MPINKTQLFRAIWNANSYLASIQLPFKEPIEQIFDNILTVSTLPMFSVFSPLKMPFATSVSDLVRVREYDMTINTNNPQIQAVREYFDTLKNDGSKYADVESQQAHYWTNLDKVHMKGMSRSANTYFLPDEILRYNLMHISSVIHDRARTSDTDIAYTWYRGSMLELVPAVVDSIAYTSLMGAMGIHERFEFLPPNKLYLRGFFDNIVIKADLMHTNLQRIPMAQYYQLFTLFNYDVRIFIFNIMNNYDGNINSAYGSINLKLENLANAEQEKAEYLRTLDSQLASSNPDWIDFL